MSTINKIGGIWSKKVFLNLIFIPLFVKTFREWTIKITLGTNYQASSWLAACMDRSLVV